MALAWAVDLGVGGLRLDWTGRTSLPFSIRRGKYIEDYVILMAVHTWTVTDIMNAFFDIADLREG